MDHKIAAAFKQSKIENPGVGISGYPLEALFVGLIVSIVVLLPLTRVRDYRT
jgi:adenine-specific DNA methylase